MAYTQTRLYGPVAAVTTDTDSSAGRYLVPTGSSVIVKQILFCNTSSTTYSASAAVGVTATAANCFISNMLIPGYSTTTFNCNVVLSAGEKMFFVAQNSAITIMANGIVDA